MALTAAALVWCSLILFAPAKAYALQVHGHIEGLYVHQAAHLFFAFSMAAFSFMLRRSGIINPRAAHLLSLGALLLAIWNLWAFSGHLIELFIPPEHFGVMGRQGAATPSLYIAGWKEALYYLLKMDHLICVPAIVCFYLGLDALMVNHPGNGADRDLRETET